MSSIRLHPKHGVNPTMPVCFYCGKDTGEIALLGAAYKGEAPRRMILNKHPCAWCQGNMQKGIVFVEAVGRNAEEVQPTGAYCVIVESAVRKMLKDPMLSDVLRRRLCFLDPPTWDALGLRGVEIPERKEDPHGEDDARDADPPAEPGATGTGSGAPEPTHDAG